MSTNKLRFSGEYGLDASGLTLTSVADPVNDTDAATKGFSKNASNLTTGIIASSILGASTLFIGTTAIALNRASGALALTGITSIDGNASTATKLATARAISFTGDATGSFTFDGSADASAALTLANSGVAASTYGSSSQVPIVTVNAKGIVTNVTLSTNITAANIVGGAAGGVVWQSAASTTGITATGTAGQLLQSQGAAAPSWISPASLTVGKATQADTVAITSGGNNSSYGVTFTDVATGYGNIRVDTGVSYNPSTKVLSATTFSGSGASLTSIPNTALNNSSVTLGTTQVALGTATTVLSGLTSVTSTNFIGGLTGNASSASTVAIVDDAATSTPSPVAWVTSNSGNQSVKTTSSKLTFTPSTGTLTSPKFVGDGSGLTGITSTATTAQVGVDTTTNSWVYPVWSTNTASGVVGLFNSAQTFAINPSTGTMALKGSLQIGAFGSIAQYALLDVHTATGSSSMALTMEGTGYTDKNRGLIVHYLPKSGNSGANAFGLRLDGDGSTPNYIDAYLIRRAADPDNSVSQHEFYTGALSVNSVSAALKFMINKSYSFFADNVGISAVPSAWGNIFKVLEFNNGCNIAAYTGSIPSISLTANTYFDGTNVIYKTTNPASSYQLQDGMHKFYVASQGTAGNTLTWTTAATIDSAGNVGISVVPSAWHDSFTGLELQYSSGIFSNKNLPNVIIFSNAYYNAQSDWIYKTNNYATAYDQYNGSHRWFNAPFGTAGGTVTFTQAMTLDVDGNLIMGPGGVPVAGRLQLQKYSTSGGEDIHFANRGTNASESSTYSVGGIYGSGFRDIYDPAYITGVIFERSPTNDGLSSSGSIVFKTSPYGESTKDAVPERMRINGYGNVLVNTSTVRSRMTIGGGCSLIIGAGSTTTNGEAGYWATIDNTTYRGYGIQVNSNNQMSIYIGDNSSSWNNSFILDAYGNMFFGIAATGSLNTTNGGVSVIPNNGGTGVSQVNIGHVNGSASGAGYIVFGYNGTSIGSVSQNGTTSVAYNTSSDYRLKTNVQPMTGALTRISQLKPVTYDWISDNTAGEGFIAHELAEVCPQAVTGEKDAVDENGNPIYQGIDTSFLVGLLVGGIQEQQAVIEAQQQTITNLQTTISDILTRLTALETKVG